MKFAEIHPDAELHVFGDGEKRKELEELVLPFNRYVCFHGKFSLDDSALWETDEDVIAR